MPNDPKQALLAQASSLVEKTAAAVLFKYTDDDGNEFYLPEKKTSPLKSPYTGKSFTPKPERSSLTDVGKELKEKKSSSPEQWELAAEILDKGMDHPAMKAVTAPLKGIEDALKDAARRSANMKKIGVGRTEDPTLVIAHVVPAIEELADTARVVAKQLVGRLK